DLVRFPVKLLVPFALLVALLAGWGIDALRDSATDWRKKRRSLLIPIECLLGITVVVWISAFIAPGWIERAAGPLLAASNRVYINSAKKELTPTEIAAGVQLLLTIVKVYLPGLAGLLLGVFVWFRMLDAKKRQAWRALPAVAAFGILRLAFVNYPVNPTVPKAFYSYPPPVLKNFAPSAMPYRVCNINRQKLSSRSKPTPQAFLNFDSLPVIARLSLLAQNDFRSRLVLARGSMLAGTESVVNSDIDLSFPVDLFHFWIFDGTQMPDMSRADCLLGRTNVKYEISDHSQNNPTLKEIATIFNGSARPSFLYLNLCAAPRAYAASGALYSASPLETLTRLSAPQFDIYQQVILTAQRGAASANPPAAAEAPAGTVKLVQNQPNTVVLKAEMRRPGYVVLLDRYSPDWQAKIDGRAASVLRANLMFRAVRVKRGKHVIRFTYHQQGLEAGLFLSLLTLLVLIGAHWWNGSGGLWPAIFKE
ncbi:MAG TPA: YfhO family protein, partial [Terriglobia bacterium]|nr:YfhO family protein [Terriglobia bacterium]